MELINLSQDKRLATNLEVADTFFSRLKGLLGTSALPEGKGLMIKPCDSVHTFGMNYAIDVVFADAEDKVLKLAPDLKPGKVSMCSGGCRYVVELPAGTIARTGTTVGDCLKID